MTNKTTRYIFSLNLRIKERKSSIKTKHSSTPQIYGIFIKKKDLWKT
jgi:hypothetical protein